MDASGNGPKGANPETQKIDFYFFEPFGSSFFKYKVARVPKCYSKSNPVYDTKEIPMDKIPND
jgi:hypothetical protein